ncbi:MAG: VWA domain-containing protein [Chloroflexi bacterium]|nr:VWA domain-containing protein [Chloroflexota bacterium]
MTTGVSVNLHTAPADAGDGTILPNLLMFGEVLRRLGLDVGSANMLDLVRATEHVPIGGNRNDFRLAARALLVHRRSDLEIFDEAFQVFWRRPAHGRSMRDLRSMGEERRYRTPRVMPHREDTSDGPPGGDDPDDAGDRQPVVDLQRSFSAREVLRQRDFADYTAAEVSAARVLMSELQWDLGSRRTRRLTWGEGRDVDLRRTMRRSLSYGGEMLDIAHRRRKNKPRPLVLICDVSGSMERYTRMLLHFVHTVAVSGQQLEAFLFATRLTRITRHLEHRGVDRAVSEVARAVPDWAGGTRIGEAVKSFNYRWARRVLRGGAVVLVISDGWDRGEPELLSREMARLQRSCHRLIWLTPLLGSPGYEPLTRGMQAALPYIDDFLPAHNLHSLQELAGHLNRLTARRAPPTARRRPPADGNEANEPEGDATHDGGVAARSRRELNPALAPTFRHPLWGHPNIPGGGS